MTVHLGERMLVLSLRVHLDARAQHQQRRVAVDVELGTLSEIDAVFDGERMQAEQPAEVLQLLLRR